MRNHKIKEERKLLLINGFTKIFVNFFFDLKVEVTKIINKYNLLVNINYGILLL